MCRNQVAQSGHVCIMRHCWPESESGVDRLGKMPLWNGPDPRHVRARPPAGGSGSARPAPRTPEHAACSTWPPTTISGCQRDPRLVEAAAAGRPHLGHRLDRVPAGHRHDRLHAELEAGLAAFTGAAAALVFSSGYLANLGAARRARRPGRPWSSPTPATMPRSSTPAGCPAPGSSSPRTRDVDAVEKRARRADEEHALVVTDAVFSVDGDLAPLRELHAAPYGTARCWWSTRRTRSASSGAGGRGAVHAAGLAGEPDVVLTVTLSKSLGSQGGAVLGAPEVIETLIDTGRSFIFDTGLAPGSVGRGTGRAGHPHSRARTARTRAGPRERLAAMARELGLETTDPADGRGRPRIVLGPPEAALAAAARLRGTRSTRRMFPPAIGARRPLLPAVDRSGRSEVRD